MAAPPSACSGFRPQRLDALAAESQRRAEIAIAEGRFAKSLVPVVKADGSLALDHEEYPRPETTVETLAGLKPSFATLADYPLDDRGTTYRSLILQKYPGLEIRHVHHAGNSSGIVDGAAAVLVGSKDAGKKAGLKPRAKIRAEVKSDRLELLIAGFSEAQIAPKGLAIGRQMIEAALGTTISLRSLEAAEPALPLQFPSAKSPSVPAPEPKLLTGD